MKPRCCELEHCKDLSVPSPSLPRNFSVPFVLFSEARQVTAGDSLHHSEKIRTSKTIVLCMNLGMSGRNFQTNSNRIHGQTRNLFVTKYSRQLGHMAIGPLGHGSRAGAIDW